jgi:phage shock protein A
MSLSESREAIARMEATIQALQSQVTDLRLQVRENAADRYSQADADRDLSRVTKEVADNRRRIERLEHP